MDKLKVLITNNQKDVKIPTGIRMLIRRCCHAVLEMENFEGSAEISVSFVNNEEIQRLNKEYRNKDAVTDVLSFPMIDYVRPGDFSVLEEGLTEDFFNPESGELILGDIILSVDKIIEQAASYGHSQQRELGFLVAHSMLHLFGYDHMQDEEREVMEEKQRDILNMLNLKR